MTLTERIGRFTPGFQVRAASAGFLLSFAAISGANAEEVSPPPAVAGFDIRLPPVIPRGIPIPRIVIRAVDANGQLVDGFSGPVEVAGLRIETDRTLEIDHIEGRVLLVDGLLELASDAAGATRVFVVD